MICTAPLPLCGRGAGACTHASERNRTDRAAEYLTALQERLTRDGCTVISPHWKGRPVVIGRRADRKARWFGTKTEVFVFPTAVPEIDLATLAGLHRVVHELRQEPAQR